VEEFTEISSNETSDPHPDLTIPGHGNRIDWRETQLRTDNFQWVTWTASSTQGTQTAYDTCLIDAYYTFFAKKGAC